MGEQRNRNTRLDMIERRKSTAINTYLLVIWVSWDVELVLLIGPHQRAVFSRLELSWSARGQRAHKGEYTPSRGLDGHHGRADGCPERRLSHTCVCKCLAEIVEQTADELTPLRETK